MAELEETPAKRGNGCFGGERHFECDLRAIGMGQLRVSKKRKEREEGEEVLYYLEKSSDVWIAR